MEPPATKEQLRREARASRSALAPEERLEKAARIREHALALPELERARTVGCYVSVGSEVDTALLLRALLVKEKRVAVPVEVDGAIRFVRLQHPWTLVPGPRGVPVPRQPWEDVSGDELDVVFVPGLLFGRDGSRLGQGGGHFDRFLHDHVNALRVALAFSEQVVDAIPAEAHDEGMDVLVTENGRIRIGRPA